MAVGVTVITQYQNQSVALVVPALKGSGLLLVVLIGVNKLDRSSLTLVDDFFFLEGKKGLVNSLYQCCSANPSGD